MAAVRQVVEAVLRPEYLRTEFERGMAGQKCRTSL